ncbi:hypothetical protein [Lentzea sp. HUAS12]|uniref:hypothetical protein n=1 Tax=Lentzea sp. HUAS12 TaxID=2951806 RepID=UPI00209CE103|nr:hypothetical protein [Lentzea sp. HUAS12]USX50487.1 hypothetical protein ND450_34700 [Lentzea sp. HUAS12]
MTKGVTYMRKFVLASTMALAAVMSVLAPGTAMAAPDWENNEAVQGTPPSSEYLICADTIEAKVWVCYEIHGDRWWVYDNDADSASATVEWKNYRGGSLYRQGRCINGHGAGTWASCNKNYYEDSTVRGKQGWWDRPNGSPRTYDREYQFQ